MANNESPSIHVDTDECLTLTPESGRFKEVYTRVNPRSAEEVRKLLGLTPEASKALHESGMCCMPSTVPARTAAAEDLDDADPQVRAAARSTTYQAFNAYVHGANPQAVAHMIPAFNRYLDINKAVINIALLSDIEVANGATLTISKSTHVVNARRIIIHRTGRIVCHGNTTFRVASVEGIKRDFVLASQAANSFQIMKS